MSAAYALSLRDLRATPGDRPALAGLSLDVATGQAVAIVGGPASGHVAALDAACGLLPLVAGRIFASGRDVTDLPPHRRGLARLHSQDEVTRGTVIENVRLAARGRDVRSTLETVGLAGRERWPVAGLPAGMRRCVFLARAAASDPACLLLDEPASGLDQRDCEPLLLAIRSLATAGQAMLIATSDAQTAFRLAARIVTMSDGAASQAGWSDELYDAPATAATAGLLGEINRLPGRVVAEEDDLVAVDLDCGLRVEARLQDAGVGTDCVVMIRPGRIAIATPELTGEGAFPARVRNVRHLGVVTWIDLDMGMPAVRLTVARPSALPFLPPVDSAVSVAWQAHAAWAFRASRQP